MVLGKSPSYTTRWTGHNNDLLFYLPCGASAGAVGPSATVVLSVLARI